MSYYNLLQHKHRIQNNVKNTSLLPALVVYWVGRVLFPCLLSGIRSCVWINGLSRPLFSHFQHHTPSSFLLVSQEASPLRACLTPTTQALKLSVPSISLSLLLLGLRLGLPFILLYAVCPSVELQREMKENISHCSSFRIKWLQDNQAFHTDESNHLFACPLCVMLLKESCRVFSGSGL